MFELSSVYRQVERNFYFIIADWRKRAPPHQASVIDTTLRYARETKRYAHLNSSVYVA